jgi:hypothetical protein
MVIAIKSVYSHIMCTVRLIDLAETLEDEKNETYTFNCTSDFHMGYPANGGFSPMNDVYGHAKQVLATYRKRFVLHLHIHHAHVYV